MKQPTGNNKQDIITFLKWCGRNDAIDTWNRWYRTHYIIEDKTLDLSGAQLSGAQLSRADLEGAELRGADLHGADLRGADLRGAHLVGANLSGAQLRGADLFGASLEGADLFRADLSRADLFGASLEGADVRGTILEKNTGGTSSELEGRIQTLQGEKKQLQDEKEKLQNEKDVSNEDKNQREKQIAKLEKQLEGKNTEIKERDKQLKEREEKKENLKKAVDILQKLKHSDAYALGLEKRRKDNARYGMWCFRVALVSPLIIIFIIAFLSVDAFEGLGANLYFVFLFPFTAFSSIGLFFMKRSKRQGDKHHRITKYQRDVEKLASILEASDEVKSDVSEQETFMNEALGEMMRNAIAELTKQTETPPADKSEIPHWFPRLIEELKGVFVERTPPKS